MAEYEIRVDDKGAYVVVTLIGAFASKGFAELKQQLDALIDENRPVKRRRFLVFNLAESTLLTSSCLETMYAAKHRAEQQDIACVVIICSEEIRELFELTDFDRLFPIHESLDSFLLENDL